MDEPHRRDPHLPPALTARRKDSYPWRQLNEAWPHILDRLRDELPYPPQIRRTIDKIAAELSADILQPWQSPYGARPAEAWRDTEHLGRPWSELPFLHAENYFASKLLDACGYHTGPWQGINPYGLHNAALLADDAALVPLNVLDTVAGLDTRERGHALLHIAATGSVEVPLLVDHSHRLWAHLASTSPGRINLVADTVAPELASDLLLIDFLLTENLATQVDLHLPPRPWRPTQATTADVLACLKRLPAHPHGSALAERLWTALVTGRIEAMTHDFYCSPEPFHIERIPADLRDSYAGARLTILKGDHNYRRLLHDRLWPHDTPFTRFTRTFPGPILALRTVGTPVLAGTEPDATSVSGLIQIGL